jgi:hypothetical protein
LYCTLENLYFEFVSDFEIRIYLLRNLLRDCYRVLRVICLAFAGESRFAIFCFGGYCFIERQIEELQR